MAAFVFTASVGEAEVAGSSSAVYTVTVRTNLAEYAEHGEGEGLPPEAEGHGNGELDDDAQLEEDVFKLATIPERHIVVKRTYSAFRELRDTLSKSRLAGAANLPSLPGKSLFATSPKDLELRRHAFAALLTHIGQHAELASADATCAFLSDVPKPDFSVVHQEALTAARAVLAVNDWTVQYAKNGIEIAVHACPSSDLHMLRSSVSVPLNVERTHAHYMHTPNWAQFTPDATFTVVQQVSDVAGVMHVRYRVPVISSRDVVLYEARLSREEMDSVAPQGGTAASAAAVARSILHPLCPTRRNVVRARLLIAVTLFYDTGDGTQIVSFQHVDPRGSIPASVVNKALVRGKAQLKAMRRVMVELG